MDLAQLREPSRVSQATRYLHEKPLAAAKTVAEATGLPAEVVYLYNGPNGIATFDTTIKPPLREALKGDVPFLESIGNIEDLNVDTFIDEGPLRAAYGSAYDTDAGTTANPARITGTDPACATEVSDPATAGEVWLDGEDTTHPTANARCLLRFVKAQQATGKKVRAAYVPDATSGTRWFADHAVWVNDPSAGPLAFATESATQDYVDRHAGATPVSYADAVSTAG